MPGPASFFPDSYSEARQRFVAMASRLGWKLESSPLLFAAGPRGEPLSIDAAFSSDGEAPCGRTLLVTGGLHGVEGRYGSAVQLAFMEAIAAGSLTIPSGFRLVLVHALNPHGYAHDRRVNDDGIDLNRNFLLPGQPFEGSPPGYRALNPLLNPAAQPGKGPDFFIPRLLLHGLFHGFASTRSAIACGQHDFPGGLFYGGSCPAESRRIAAGQLARWIPPGSDAAILIDLHTGLGRRGQATLLTTTTAEERAANPVAAGFQEDEISSMASSAVAYPARGTFTAWVQHHQQARRFHPWGLEIGAYPALQTLAALRRENRLSDAPAKALLRETFVPADPHWRDSVLTRSLDILRQALATLASAP